MIPTKLILELQPGELTDKGREFFEYLEWWEKHVPIMGSSGTFSNYTETSVLDHIGKTAWTSPSTYLCLCTVVPDSSKTGATIVEPTNAAYVGYGRSQIPATGWNAAVSGGAGATSTKTNHGTFSMNNCTGGTGATIIGWALCDSATVGSGNMLGWGSCTSVVISPVQTPPTVPDQSILLTLL